MKREIHESERRLGSSCAADLSNTYLRIAFREGQ
jgi:hypothetical protein